MIDHLSSCIGRRGLPSYAAVSGIRVLLFCCSAAGAARAAEEEEAAASVPGVLPPALTWFPLLPPSICLFCFQDAS